MSTQERKKKTAGNGSKWGIEGGALAWSVPAFFRGTAVLGGGRRIISKPTKVI